jgi:hypothetical protein
MICLEVKQDVGIAQGEKFHSPTTLPELILRQPSSGRLSSIASVFLF